MTRLSFLVFFIISLSQQSKAHLLDCPQTSGGPVPSRADVRWTIDPEKKVMDLSTVHKLLRLAESDKRFDYTPCLLPIIKAVQDDFENSDNIEQSHDWTKTSFEELLKIRRSFDKYREKHAKLPHPSLPDAPLAGLNKDALKENLRRGRRGPSEIGLLLSGALTENEVRAIFDPPTDREVVYSRDFYERELLSAIEQSFPSENKCRAAPDYCESYSAGLKRALDRLAKSNPTIALALKEANLETSCSVDRNQISALAAVISEAAPCAPLRPGQAYVFHNTQFSQASRAYQMKREILADGTEHFEATVNLRFPDDQPEEGEKSMAEKVRACFNQVNPSLYNEDGVRLTLNLKDDESVSPTIIRTQEIDRANETEWGDNPECSLIIHETMHLLGLPDEYEEQSYGEYSTVNGKRVYTRDPTKPPPYDCRITGPADSLLSKQKKAFESVVPPETATQCKCDLSQNPKFVENSKRLAELLVRIVGSGGMGISYVEGYGMTIGRPGVGMGGTPANPYALSRAPTKPMTEQETLNAKRETKALVKMQDQLCAEHMPPDAESRTTCPVGFAPSPATLDSKLSETPWYEENSESTLPRFFHINRKQPPPKRKSLLFPAQARSIMTGGCKLNNKTYTECATDAYKTSASRGGRDICKAKNNPFCKDRSSQWLDGSR